ncbi:MAG: hypothetical protein QGF59_10865, partial [Pirellulaceae bacterium]|nr:hypothetical protein [Pirellulaceae bacterium]
MNAGVFYSIGGGGANRPSVLACLRSSGVTVGTPGVGTGWHLFDIEVSNGTARARMNGGAYSSTIPFTPPGPQARIDLKNTATRGGFDDVRI